MKKIKRIYALVVAVVVIFIFTTIATPVSASTYVGQVKVKEGGFLGIGATKYTYKIYYEERGDLAIVAPKKLLTSSSKHTYGKTPKTIYGETSRAYTYSTTLAFNKGAGVEIGVSKLISLAAEKGYGVTTGISYSKEFVKGVEFTPDRYDKTGYYVVAGGATCKRMKWQKYLGSDKLDSQYGYFFMPYGPRVTYTMYSTDNGNWEFY